MVDCGKVLGSRALGFTCVGKSVVRAAAEAGQVSERQVKKKRRRMEREGQTGKGCR